MMSYWPFICKGARRSHPILFLHGYLGTGEDWMPVAQLLGDHFFSIMPDLPGHGRNTDLSKTRTLSFSLILKGLITFQDELGIKKAHLVGYSMGGRIALFAAANRPERFTSIVLESSSPGIQDLMSRQRRAELDDQRAQTIQNVGIETFLEQWYEMELFRTLKAHPLRFEDMKTKRKKNDPFWAAKIIRELSPGRQPGLWDKLNNLPMPTLLITGEQDFQYTAILKQMAEIIPHATLQTVPDAGHNVHQEKPDRFAAHLQNFLLVSI